MLSKNDTVVRQSLETCKELLNQSNTFINGTVDKVKETCNISKQTNGPEGTVSKRTQDSVYMLYHSIIHLSQSIFGLAALTLTLHSAGLVYDALSCTI
jgi:hypothetical protein